MGWAFLLVDAWRIGQPLSLSMPHRRAAIGVNGALCLFVASALLFGSHLVGAQRDLVQTMFGSGEASDASHGRYNVLLLGGDSGADRWGLRPDSLTIASIDEENGKTVLISLPRNMTNFPFAPGSVMEEQFPDGFDCGEECMLNGVSTWAGDNTELFPKSKNPGVDATIMAVEGITGLEINYWAMVNLRGLPRARRRGRRRHPQRAPADPGRHRQRRQLRAAGRPQAHRLRDPVVRPGPPGLRRLLADGPPEVRDDRDAAPDQPADACSRNFSRIAKASSEMVSTNIPAGEVGSFVDLALKAKGQKIATLSLVPPLVNTGNPDIPALQAEVVEAIDRSEGDYEAPEADDAGAEGEKPKKKDKPKPTPVVTGGSVGSLSQGYAANQSEDVDSGVLSAY